MKMPLAVSLIVGFIVVGLTALLMPSVRLALLLSPPVRPILMNALGNYTDTDSHAKYFLLLMRQHQYADAHSLLTPRAKMVLTASFLQGQWVAFESVHGRVTKWMEAGGTDNLVPEYVDRRYQVSGSRGSSALVTLRLTRPADSPTTSSPDAISAWQIDSLTISR